MTCEEAPGAMAAALAEVVEGVLTVGSQVAATIIAASRIEAAEAV
jgi:hypothetical protein